MFEISQNRTYNVKVFLNDDGSKTLRSHVGHIHYRGTDGVMKDVNFGLEDMGTYWQMVKASYKLLIAKDFGANQLIRFQNKYRGANHEIIYEPKMLAWVNKSDLSDMQVFRNQQSVQGYITGENQNVIRYDNAFGNGLHFEITLLRSGFKKEIVIEAKNKLKLPPTSDHKLVALFAYGGSGLNIRSMDKLRGYIEGSYFEEQDGFRIQEAANEVYQSFIRPAYIIDKGAETPSQENIKVFWKTHNGKLWQAKVLPKVFLQNAIYPVRADTTTQFYFSNTDGRAHNQGSVWTTIRNASQGVSVQNTVASGFLYSSYAGIYYCNRMIFKVDTSDLTVNSNISSATFNFYTDSFTLDGSARSVALVTAQDSIGDSAISTYSYYYKGTTELATRIPQASLVSGQYNSFSLNATGIATIAKNATTKFMIREGQKDFDNVAPTDHKYHQIYFSEDTSGTKDPYLEVVFTDSPNVGSIAYDAISKKVWASGSTHTFAHTCSGDNRVLLVNVFHGSSTTVSGVTYAGTAMTYLGIQANASTAANRDTVYYIVNPATGAAILCIRTQN